LHPSIFGFKDMGFSILIGMIRSNRKRFIIFATNYNSILVKSAMNSLEQLRQYSKVVADIGDFESILAYRPVDATTNPSLIYVAACQEKYRYLVEKAVSIAKRKSFDPKHQLSICLDEIALLF